MPEVDAAVDPSEWALSADGSKSSSGDLVTAERVAASDVLLAELKRYMLADCQADTSREPENG
jgi:hypothetical protein